MKIGRKSQSTIRHIYIGKFQKNLKKVCAECVKMRYWNN